MSVSICLLYPDLLGTYGDGGNATVLQRRMQWRGIDAEIVNVNLGEAVPQGCDIYLLGGGEDQPQTSVTRQLAESRALHTAVEKGAAVFAVCAGMQILGNRFAVAGDKFRDGLGLLDIETVRGEGARRVGELTAQPNDAIGGPTLTGYENHGGVTLLGKDVKPLASVVTGKGNDDGRGNEGAVSGRVIGTYLHGPALARNAHLADTLIGWVVGKELKPLDDAEIEDLRNERLKAAKGAASSEGWRRLLGRR